MNRHKAREGESSATATDAEFAASSPEIQGVMGDYKRFLATLSDADRAKLNNVVKLLKKFTQREAPITSDTQADLLIEKAVHQTQVDKELFDRWWAVLTPVLSCGVSFERACSSVWAKIAPGLLRGDPLGDAKLAAKDLKVAADRIYEEARRSNKRFFIDLGKCLSGEIKPDLMDAIDNEILRLLSITGSISAKQAVQRLSKKGWQITEENFRVRKQRLKAAIAAGREGYDRSQKT